MKKSKWSVTLIRALSLLLLLVAVSNNLFAAPGDVDPSFDAGSGINGGVAAIALQPDGKLLIGGGFGTVRGLVRTGIARLNADGSGDSTFLFVPDVNTGFGGASAIAFQSDGKILVAQSGIRRIFPIAVGTPISLRALSIITLTPRVLMPSRFSRMERYSLVAGSESSTASFAVPSPASMPMALWTPLSCRRP
jgi:hypothetical protein